MTTQHSRIESQKEMQNARRTLTFCYLCGEDLPSDKARRVEEVTGEHVIPRSLLGDPPGDQATTWPVELDAHRQCEELEKQHVDHWLKLFQEIHVKPSEQWTQPGHLHNLPVHPSQVVHPDTGEMLPAFTGCNDLLNGVWRWIKGLHAALYLQYLSHDADHLVLPPVPACSNQDGGPTLDDTEQQSHVIRQMVTLAESLDKWDGITAWGGALRYRCVWWQRADPTGKPNWMCFWALTFPFVAEWSRQVLGPGSERPWHGWYVCEARPTYSAWLASEDLPKKCN